MNFYSVHSWVGIVVIVLSLVQYLSALAAFFLFKEQTTAETKAWLMVHHRRLGKFIVLFGVVACILGWAGVQGITVYGYAQPYFHNATMLQSTCAVVLLMLGGLLQLLPSPPPTTSTAPVKILDAEALSA
eukprot:jgi/Botrbrau1/23227/Bobra.0041s0069.1